ncbi:MAG: hypothetical protein ACLGSD_06735 [Acidobacteriota bacterium]
MNTHLQRRGAARPPIAPGLRLLVQQASRALAHLDADRLEELARTCAALQRDLRIADAVERAEIAREARQAAGDMAVFARVLDATRSNLEVMRRLRDLRQGAIEYTLPGAQAENQHGID